MMKNTPVVTVTCFRDLPLLELQAQSIGQYLAKDCPVYIIINEEDPANFLDFFNQHIKHYYKDHDLIIFTRQSFDGEWWHWIPSAINPWAVGWETQQILKLAVAKKLDSLGFLILDSQNFLIKSYNPNGYNLAEGKIPYRPGNFSMPLQIWEDYQQSLEVSVPNPTNDSMSVCTPIFMHTDLVKSLIDSKGGLAKFSKWFKTASRIKSEFILYILWAEKHGGIDQLHQQVNDWGNPMLRDSNTFSKDFDQFVNRIGSYDQHCWVSANHRSWGDMTDEQYQILCTKLAEYNLFPKFDEYRRTYVDIKF